MREKNDTIHQYLDKHHLFRVLQQDNDWLLSERMDGSAMSCP
jgi:hypothetical protein